MINEKKNSLRHHRYFNESWLTDSSFKGWLCKEKDETKARCSLCHKTIELSFSGQSALTDHAKGKKHQVIVMKRNIFLDKKRNLHIAIINLLVVPPTSKHCKML